MCQVAARRISLKNLHKSGERGEGRQRANNGRRVKRFTHCERGQVPAGSFNTHVSLVTLLNTQCIRNVPVPCVCHQTRFLADGLVNLLHKYSRIHQLLFERDNPNKITPVHLFLYFCFLSRGWNSDCEMRKTSIDQILTLQKSLYSEFSNRSGLDQKSSVLI